MKLISVKFQCRVLKHVTPVNTTSFPAYEHRCLLKIKVGIEVFANEQEVKHEPFLDWLETLYRSTISADYKDAQTMCDELSAQILSKHPDRYVRISITEDDEYGTESEYNILRKYVDLPNSGFINQPQTQQTIKEVIVEQQISKVNATPMLDPSQPTPIMREEIGTPFVRQSVGPVEGQIATGTVTGLVGTLPEVVQQTLNADVLLPNTQTVVTEAVYPEGVTIPPTGLVIGRNSEGHQVKYENGLAFISVDGYEWVPAPTGANILMVQIR